MIDKDTALELLWDISNCIDGYYWDSRSEAENIPDTLENAFKQLEEYIESCEQKYD